jgi:calcium binding protein 39
MPAGGGDSFPTKPFEWLSGGLFFGGKNNNNNNNNNANSKEAGVGIESVDSEKDVSALLHAIYENLDESLDELASSSLSPSATASAIPTGNTNKDHNNTQQLSSTSSSVPVVASGSTPTEAGGEDSSSIVKESSTPSPSAFLAARLARLRFLLYDERRITSQQDNPHRRGIPSVALTTVQTLSSPSSTTTSPTQNSQAIPPLRTLIPKLIDNLHVLPFESRKHVAAIFNYLLVCGLEGNDRDLYSPVMTDFCYYVDRNFEPITTPILKGHHFGPVDVTLHCGSMYRSCFRHAMLYKQLVCTTERVEQYVYPFLDKFALLPNFDVSSDAMDSLKLVMTTGCDNNNQGILFIDEQSQKDMSEMAAVFLARDYEGIWDERFNPQLLSDKAGYMVKRIALQILSTVLLTRSNYAVMIRYVNSRPNLILVMKLLRDTSPHINLDAFHVFKVFVANPNKLPEVEKILRDNSTKLCAYLETLHQDKETNDQQFADEKRLIITTIQNL